MTDDLKFTAEDFHSVFHKHSAFQKCDMCMETADHANSLLREKLGNRPVVYQLVPGNSISPFHREAHAKEVGLGAYCRKGIVILEGIPVEEIK